MRLSQDSLATFKNLLERQRNHAFVQLEGKVNYAAKMLGCDKTQCEKYCSIFNLTCIFGWPVSSMADIDSITVLKCVCFICISIPFMISV